MSVTSQPFQWYRETRVSGKRLSTEGLRTDVHQDLTLKHPNEDAIELEASFWNLNKPKTWSNVRKDDPIEVDLGFVDGPSETVFIGSVSEIGSTEVQGSDTKYTLKATDESEARIRATRVSKTLNRPSVRDVIVYLAGEANVGLARVDVPDEPIVDRRYPIRRKKPANKWLDRMKSEATELDPNDREYKWKAEAGQLYFWPAEEARESSAVVLKKAQGSQPGNIESLEVSEGKTKKSEGPPDLDFEAYLDPRMGRDRIVSVQNTAHDGQYRVSKCTLESSVTDRVHKMSGTLTDPSSEFRIKRQYNANRRRGGR